MLHIDTYGGMQHIHSCAYHTQVGHGLDPAAFVFASFNQPFKITPKVWGVWMRLLLAVPHAQLWVVKLNEGAGAEAALRASAAALGVTDGRIVFTGSADLDQHVGYTPVTLNPQP